MPPPTRGAENASESGTVGVTGAASDVGDDVGRGDEVGGDVGDNVGWGDVARGGAAGTSDATVGLPHAERAATLNMHSRSRCTGERYLP